MVSESGLYKLVMRSDKPEAREFQHWVTSVVLPAIRRTAGTSWVRRLRGGHWLAMGVSPCVCSSFPIRPVLRVPRAFLRGP